MVTAYIAGIFCVTVPLIGGIILRFFRIGYHTEASNQNKETRVYAHKLSGNIMLLYSAVTIPLFIVLLIFFHDFFYNRYPFAILVFGIASDLIGGALALIITEKKTRKFGNALTDKKSGNN